MTETQVAENPLLEGLGPRRAPEPCALVIFGASGDLTHRKIFPALYALACRKLLPEQFAIVGAARSDWSDDEFRDQMEHAVREFGRDDFNQEVWDRLAEATHYVAIDFADEEPGRQAHAAHERARRGARHPRQPRLLPRSPAAGDADGRPGARRAPQGRRLDAPDRREAVRPRPRLRARADLPDQRALHRGRGLPHRPLPRQGDGPEHARAAVRERHLRADLEPPVRRPRPDHGRRDARRRGPRRLLRAGGRDPRHLPEPHAPARRADRDGAADRLHRRLGAEREGQGAEGDPHARPAGTSSAASTARATSRARRCPGTARRKASTRTR